MEEKQTIIKKIKRRIKTAKRALLKVEQQLEEALQWEKVQQRAVVLQSNLYQIKDRKEFTLTDWESGEELHFVLKRKPHAEVAALFKKARKGRDGVEPLKEQVERNRKGVAELEQLLLRVEADEVVDDPFPAPGAKRQLEPRLPYREFLSPTGTVIWVGRSAKDNEEMTFSHANGRDTWLHVHGCPGSHVVVRSENPDQETLEMAVQLAMEYSKGSGRQEVIVTHVKHLKRYKGKTGAVSVSKRRTMVRDPRPLP